MQKRVYKGFDLLKLLCSILIIFLHINPLPHDGIAYHLTRALGNLGVPCFFIISGYLFCENTLGLNNKEYRTYFLKYEKRIGQMFLFWLIPYFLVYDMGTHSGLLEYLFYIFCDGGFLWYLVSQITGMAGCAAFHKNLKLEKRWIIAGSLLLIGILSTSYYVHLPDPIQRMIDWYNSSFTTMRNGLFFGFPCIYIGMLLCLKREKFEKIRVSGLIASVFLFSVEFTITHEFHVMQFSVIALSIFLVMNAAEINLSFNTFWLRKLSFLIYVIHPLLIRLIPLGLSVIASTNLDYYWYLYNWIQIPIILLLSIAIAAVIIKLSKKIPLLKRGY